ncbi:cell envelope integrity protein CreD [Pseudoalteromonas luteoviolacea]|uniref:Inner membrane protein n=1 Tax=Pseudoalteromonas luteoviolacea (strain 2ta16) TaxID=1353533 RepID=V4HLP6_PSEL2|nr:cell envelope integrity protein CreD [Pseudoalteromonas luteoviolacea]ESP90703.1 Inner membrane protein [Pseudoalteromonas luteoviolacea 2ta16]KZN41722.1 hypothetical protein N483_13715 [Pseudoalteromonas luteoviolacea NCIMB 1944]
MNNQNKEKMGVKFATLIGIIIFLMIPLMLIKDLIDERSQMQQQVQREIAKSSSDEQRLIGPFLYIEFEREVELKNETKVIKDKAFVLPETLKIHSKLDTFEKYRSIYKATLYRSINTISGEFSIAHLHALRAEQVISASLVFGIEDIRGIGLDSILKVSGQEVDILPGSLLNSIQEGVHAPISVSQLANETLTFSADLHLQGMTRLSLSPLGSETHLSMSANWPHPSFEGEYLPLSSEISDESFTARWQASYFSTNMQSIFTNCVMRSQCQMLYSRTMGVALVDPVDHYLKSHRAINYALLVILLVMASFFLLELVRSEPIHPVQYGFVGLALAIFYLLLISLSEHLGFGAAYLISTLSATGLLGWYVTGILKSLKLGLYFSAGLIMLYSLLYSMLGAEDYALLMGSLMCFMVLSLVMILTRKVNWYGHARSQQSASEATTNIKNQSPAT